MASKQPKSKDKPYSPKINKPRSVDEIAQCITWLYGCFEKADEDQKEPIAGIVLTLEWALGDDSGGFAELVKKHARIRKAN